MSNKRCMNNNFDELFNTPAWREIREISNKFQKNIPTALLQLAAILEPYAQLQEQLLGNIKPVLMELAHISTRLALIDRIGKAEFVYWKSLPTYFIDNAPNGDILDFLYEWLKDDNFKEVKETIEKLKEEKNLKGNPVLLQSISAYERGDYDLAALGFTAMIDKMLSIYSGMMSSTNIKKRVEEIEKKVKGNGDSSLSEEEYNDYVLISTWTNAMNGFGADSRFNEPEPDLNRHWIAHGRMEKHMCQIDCIRVIHFLYGTILMGELSKQG